MAPRGIVFLLFVLLGGLADPAFAQEAVGPDGDGPPEATPVELAEDEAAAQAHFLAGSSYFQRGEYERAMEELEIAYDLSRRPALLYNIALCLERLGRYGEAAERLARYLDEEDPDAIRQRTALEARLANLRERAALDDEEVEAPAGPDLLVPAVVAFSTGGLGLVGFALFGSLALAEDGSLASSCGADTTRSCDDAALSDLRTFTVLADVFWPLALVGAGTGAVLLWLHDGDGEEAEASVTVLPFVSPSGLGLVAGGAF
jgi:tetratricopeptide (TPR) repeat protein